MRAWCWPSEPTPATPHFTLGFGDEKKFTASQVRENRAFADAESLAKKRGRPDATRSRPRRAPPFRRQPLARRQAAGRGKSPGKRARLAEAEMRRDFLQLPSFAQTTPRRRHPQPRHLLARRSSPRLRKKPPQVGR